MLIIYASRTGNVKRFVDKVGIRSINVKETGGKADEPYILVTYTDGFGGVPYEVEEFLKDNHKNLIAVGASGNRNWGANFAQSANKISHWYNVPIIIKFELSGTKEDVQHFKKKIERLMHYYEKKK